MLEDEGLAGLRLAPLFFFFTYLVSPRQATDDPNFGDDDAAPLADKKNRGKKEKKKTRHSQPANDEYYNLHISNQESTTEGKQAKT